MRTPTKTSCLNTLKAQGLNVKAIIDVGIMHETRELKDAFPKIKHYLFEPVAEFYPTIRKNYAALDYELVAAAASDQSGTAMLETRAVLTPDAVTHSHLSTGSRSGHDSSKNSRLVRRLRIDEFAMEKNLPSGLLLKIDVDGAELDVLRGAERIFDRIDCIIIEASRFYFHERLDFLHRAGFRLFDIVDICYYHDMFHQADLVFLKREMLLKPAFDGWRRGPFQRDAWQKLT